MSDQPSALALLAQAKRDGRLADLPQAIPYAAFMGFTVGVEQVDSVQGSDSDVKRLPPLLTTLRYGDHLIGNPALPALHGGTLASLLEHGCLFELFHQTDLDRLVDLPKTITFTVEYLRSAGPRDVFAQASMTRAGRRVCNLTAVAWQDSRDKPVATCTAVFLLPTQS